jgi:hypothetical protein
MLRETLMSHLVERFMLIEPTIVGVIIQIPLCLLDECIIDPP